MNTKIILLLYFICFFLLNLKANNDTDIRPLVIKLIIEEMPYIESNPLWKKSAEEVNSFFIEVLNKKGGYKEKKEEELRIEAFKLLYNNSISDYEDASDIYRVAKKRSLCFTSIAILANSYISDTFLEDAKNCIKGINPGSSDYLKELILIDLLGVLIMIPDKTLTKDVIRKTNFYKNLLKNKDDISDKKFVEKLNTICK